MNTVSIAVVQMNATPDREQNLAKAEELVRAAAGAGAELVALPEYFSAYGHAISADSLSGHYAAAREPVPGPTSERLGRLSSELEIHLLGGSYFEGDGGLTYNTSSLFDPGGSIVATYRKTHLFEARSPTLTYVEESAITAGSELTSARIVFGKREVIVGMSICFDVRFPEIYRALAVGHGAELFFVPAAFPEETGRDHWELLLRARAVENQAFVVAPAQWGPQADGGRLHGRSLVVNPWGTVLATVADGEGFAITTIDLDEATEYRNDFPNLANRRPSLYP